MSSSDFTTFSIVGLANRLSHLASNCKITKFVISSFKNRVLNSLSFQVLNTEPYITEHPCLSSISNDIILEADLSGISETRNPESNFPLLAKVVQHFSLFGEGRNNQEKM